MERANLYPEADKTDTAISSDEQQLLTATQAPPETAETIVKPKKISLQQLINKLNYLNFLDKPLYVNFRHKQYQRALTIKAKPQPCQDNRLACLWQEDANNLAARSDFFAFENIIIPDGKRFLVAEPDMLEFDRKAIRFLLPETCSASDLRSARRHRSKGINVYVTQNGALFYGSMIDFSAFSFRIQVRTAPPQTFDWIDTELAVNVILFDGNKTLYTGECEIVKQTHGHDSQDWIVCPLNKHIRRFRPKEFRSTRQKMNPLPTVSFDHPLSKKRVHLEVLDLSGSGLAVWEEMKQAVLVPGLIIPKLHICFGDGAHVSCAAQVVYSEHVEGIESEGMLRCGIAILDMAADDHIKVLSLIHQAGDKNAYLCNRVDLDDLWNFFFETGFIYPQKYEFIQKNKDRIKQTYKKLYTQNPDIARHFIHQRNGVILGHMAIVRFYGRSWLMHHLAAIRSSTSRGGVAVFNQIGSFINDSHRLKSIKMSYAFCYYRPENKFPNHVFGGATKNIDDPKRCSIDQFAYYHLRHSDHQGRSMPDGWRIDPISDADLRDLECHYEEQSGGLMIRTLDLDVENFDISETERAFARIGLIRSRYLHAIKKKGDLKAIVMINIADIGLNMSDLTNSTKVFILKPKDLSASIIHTALLALFEKLGLSEMPILTFPAHCAEKLNLPSEKIYNLWAFDLNYTDDYFRYLKRLFKFFKQ